MTVATKHPEESLLYDFTLGRLDETERAGIERHLEACSSCCALLGQRAESRDTLLDLARQAAATPTSNPSLTSISSIPPELANHPRYRIIAPLGEGGMGVVYKAEHKLMDRVVALKLINKRLTANDQAIERFRREVRAAAKLGHANIVTAYEAEEVNGLPFLVMEYVEGISLDRFVVRQKNPIPVAMACHFIRQAALGLQHAHRQGMVHRDIKPHNLMLTRKGQIKILDFGLARVKEDTTPDGLSTPELVVGTPDYLAPEQARNSHDVDIRADIYALGCTLYFLLARRVPFPGGSAFEKMIKHTEDVPEPLGKIRPDLPPEVYAIVEKMMAKDKTNRYQTPVELANALSPFAKLGASSATEMAAVQPVLDPIFLDELPANAPFDTEVLSAAPTHRTRTSLATRRNQRKPWWLIPVLAAALLVCGSFIGWLATRDKNDSTPIDPAKASAQKNETNSKQPASRDPRPKKGEPRAGDYKVLIVVPKNGLYYPDFEPVQRVLEANGVRVSIVSMDWGPVQFFNNAPPNMTIRPDFALSAREGFDWTDCHAIVCVGANVNEYDPTWTAKKDWQKEGKQDPALALGDLLRKMRDANRIIGSVCTGQAVLHWHKIITTQRVATVNSDPLRYNLPNNYPTANWQGKYTVVTDGRLITASGPEQAAQFAQDLIKAIQSLPQ
jgi:eukaryotic-like serine/threonine-protein kinase